MAVWCGSNSVKDSVKDELTPSAANIARGTRVGSVSPRTSVLGHSQPSPGLLSAVPTGLFRFSLIADLFSVSAVQIG